jgi:hypothetical protein
MYFSERTRQRIRIGLYVVAVYGGVVLLLAWVFPSASVFGISFAKWFLGILLFLVTYVTLEWLGSKLLALPFWARMTSPVRILLLVFVIALVVAAAIAAVGLSSS